MSISHKSSNTQSFRLMLYRRALHPELFDLQGRRCHRQPEYEVESWVTPAGHILRFQVDGKCLTEAVLESSDHLPEMGLVYALPCLGEKDYELGADESDLGYVTTIQTETLSENLYMATYREMRDFATETGALCHHWKDAEGGLCLSLLDSQKYKKEYHIQGYHLVGSSGMVLRTQSIFEAR
jgi:hypothetical protein